MSRPAREKNRRRRVLVVAICSPRPSAPSSEPPGCGPSPVPPAAPLAAKRPDGMWFRPTPYLRSRMAFSISAWRRWQTASSSRVSPSRSVPEAVIAARWRRGPVGNRAWANHPPDDEPHRCGAGLSPEGGVGGLRHIGGAVHPVGDRRPVMHRESPRSGSAAFVLADGDGRGHPSHDRRRRERGRRSRCRPAP